MTKRDREMMVEGVLKRWRKLQEEVQMVEDDAANMAFSQGSGEPVQSSSISDKTARGAFLLETVQHLLERDGYFTQNTVFDQYREQKRFFKENLYIKQIPAIMQMLDLERVKASKKLKEKYNILIAGYPYLFIRKQGD